MTTELIASLYEYGVWANERLLAQAAKLTDAEWRRRSSQGYQSIHETFVHLLGGDLRWFARWQGETPPAMLAPADYPTLEAIRTAWAPLVDARRRYIARLGEPDLAETIQWTFQGAPRQLPRWQALLQCANHGTQHRSEIAAMLTDAGHSPGDIDYVRFCEARRAIS
jgi:uncharacterized damage-inducible protein DinB